MTDQNKTPILPWYFRPWPVIITYFTAWVIMIAPYVLNNIPLGNITIAATWFGYAILYCSWPLLLYQYLASHASKHSRHRPGRSNKLYVLLLAFVALGAALDAFGLNTPVANEPADTIIIPIFVLLFILIWRASDLLVELEGRESFKHPDPVLRAFLAMIYFPFFIFWFAKRLRRLKSNGII